MQVTNSIKSFLKANYKVLILCVLIALVSFPFLTLFYLPGIDGSLPWAFNFLVDDHFEIGQHIIFPHGPLAFFMYPLNMGNNLIVYILVRILVSMLLSFSIFSLAERLEKYTFVFPFIISLLIHAIAEFQVLVIVVVVLQSILFFTKEKRSHLWIAVFFSVFNLYIKSYGGIICALTLFSLGIYLWLNKRSLKPAITLLLSYLCFYLLFWLAMYKSLGGSFDFLRGQLELSADNSEAVSFYQVNNWFWIALSLLCFIAVPFLDKTKALRMGWSVILVPLFGAWKHAMSRGDNPHVGGLLSFITICFFLFWLLADDKKISLLIVGVIGICSFTINMASTAIYNDFAPQQDLAIFRPNNFYRLFDATQVSKHVNDSTCKALNKEDILPDTIRKLIGKASVDVYPCNQSIIAMNNFKWQPRPSIHSYAAYTSWLDKKNADYYASERAADFIIWQTDIMGGEYGSIDQRYLLNDAPQAFLQFLSRYKKVYVDGKVSVYEKLETPLAYSQKTTVSHILLKFGEWMPAPQSNINEIVRLRCKISSTFLGKLRSAVYKGVAVGIEYEFENGEKRIHKIVPKNAADGLWINPMPLHPNGAKPSTVKRFRILCWEDNLLEKEMEIAFESVKFISALSFLN